MIFIILLALTTLAIAGCAAAFSVYGLANIFAGAFISVVIMGASLEAGKLITASFLYRFWEDINVLMRIYLVTAIVTLMAITSMGIFGYLSAAYQQDTLSLKKIDAKINLLRTEKIDLSSRLKQIDDDIARVGANYITKRIELKNEYAPERKRIDNRVVVITKEIRDLTNKKIQQQVHIGPIVYIAKAFGVELDDATKWIIFALIFVFDPLAVVLTICVNIALVKRTKKQVISDGIKEIDDLRQRAEQLNNQYVNDSNHYLDLISTVRTEYDKLQHDVHSQKEEIEKAVQEVSDATDHAYKAIEEAKVEIPKAAKSSIRELEEHLAYLNEQQELSPEELEERDRIEHLLDKASSKEEVMRKIRSGSS